MESREQGPSRVWITGASQGLGAALARTVPFPAEVFDVSRRGGTPGTTHVPADLATREGWEAAESSFTQGLRDFPGPRAVLVCNAGTIEPVGFAGEVDGDAYRAALLLNAVAPLVLGDAFLRALRLARFRGTSSIVQISSGAARSPYPGWSAYCAAKAAVDQWVRVVGRERGERGDEVRVVSVAPGVVDTAMQARVRATEGRDFPRVGRFRGLHERGELRPPAQAAADVWRAVAQAAENGAVVDVRR